MSTPKEANFYSENIEDFIQFMYNQDSDQFFSILISDIENNIYGSLNDLVVQVPFLKQHEYKKLELYFNPKKILRMTSKKFCAQYDSMNNLAA